MSAMSIAERFFDKFYIELHTLTPVPTQLQIKREQRAVEEAIEFELMMATEERVTW